MRKTLQRRLTFESLETMTLMSGVLHPAIGALAAQMTTGPISFVGTARGTFHFGRAPGAPVTFSATGNLTPVGHATVTGSVQQSTANPSGSVTVAARHGKIFATLADPSLSTTTATYEITGGTGVYSGATGAGEAIVSFAQAKGKGPTHGSLTITFEPLVVA